MLKYAKVINEETKEVQVGLGSNVDFYKSIGMSLHNVAQGYDGTWYLEGYEPIKPQSLINQERINELENYLTQTDWYAIRYSETGKEIPDTVIEARAKAREEISQLRKEGGENVD